jgi:hypothetical protein
LATPGWRCCGGDVGGSASGVALLVDRPDDNPHRADGLAVDWRPRGVVLSIQRREKGDPI